MGNSQAQIRFTQKLHFLVGLARRIVEMNGVASLPPVQSDIARLATYAAMAQGLVYAAEYNAAPNGNGYMIPGLQETYANMNLQSEIYPQMLNLVRELAGGGLIQMPSSVADLTSDVTRGDVTKYVQSPGVPGEERIKLLKLAWDLIGSEFAGRHEQYEKFYAGAPFIVRSHMWRTYDFNRAGALVDHALSGYDVNGRR
jgi:4-hydroxyphenylacetate 3-monooxygenase